MNTQNIKLDISKESPGYPIVRIGQGDSSGTTIRATVYDNGSTPTLTGMTVKMHMRLPDGKSYAEGGNCSVSGNVITCVVDESRFAVVDGYTNDAYFSLTTGTTIYSTSRFRVKVEKAASKDADPAGMYTDDVAAATRAAREAADAATEAIEQIGTAVDDAQQAAEDAAQAVTDAQTAIQDADAAKQSATTAANQATAAANNANSKANLANTAANNANTATSAANDATTRADAAIDAMGDISEQAVPVMSADVRGGAKIQPNSGLEITDTDNLQVRLALESEGDVRGGILGLTAKGHAEQVSTTGKNLLPNNATSQTINGVTFTVNADGSVTCNGTATAMASLNIAINTSFALVAGQTYTLTGVPSGGSSITYFMMITDDVTISYFEYGSGVTFTPTESFVANNYKARIRIASGYTCNNLTIYPQLELGSTATDYEPYSGGAPSPRPDWEQPIEVVRGHEVTGKTGRYVDMEVRGKKNLFDESHILKASGWTVSNGVYTGDTRELHVAFGPSTSGYPVDSTFDANTQYTISLEYVSPAADIVGLTVGFLYTDGTTRYMSCTNSGRYALTSKTNSTISKIHLSYGNSVTVSISNIQLEKGTEATEYIPYRTTTPIPLPQRGWVGSLPDGTADVLTLDGAGKCEWELADAETTTAATDGITGTVGTDVLSTTGQIADGATVLYPLATPVTEDCGYCEDWPTDIPEGATVTISELDSVGIKYFIDSGVTELAKQWYAKSRSEYEDRLTSLEDTVAQLIAEG